MFDYLIQRENDEMFRTTVRRLTFPDGITRDVEAYRLIWNWFDRSNSYEFGMDEEDILRITLKCAAEEGVELGQAMGMVLNHSISNVEASGADYTDDNIELLVAQQGMQRFRERKQR